MRKDARDFAEYRFAKRKFEWDEDGDMSVIQRHLLMNKEVMEEAEEDNVDAIVVWVCAVLAVACLVYLWVN